MKDKLRGIFLGVLIGAMVMGSVVLAANTTTLYNVVTNGVKIVVDGMKLNPTDANGSRVEPIIYNGTTYLPVRAVADALGKAVYWDGPNYTVYLGEMGGKLDYPTVEFEDMTSIASKPKAAESLLDNYGNSYTHAIENGQFHTELQYLLNMKYSRLKGVLYVPEGVTNARTCSLEIIADGKRIYTSPTMTKTSRPVFVDVNICGCNELIFKFTDEHVHYMNGSTSGLELCFGDAGFYQ